MLQHPKPQKPSALHGKRRITVDPISLETCLCRQFRRWPLCRGFLVRNSLNKHHDTRHRVSACLQDDPSIKVSCGALATCSCTLGQRRTEPLLHLVSYTCKITYVCAHVYVYEGTVYVCSHMSMSVCVCVCVCTRVCSFLYMSCTNTYITH